MISINKILFVLALIILLPVSSNSQCGCVGGAAIGGLTLIGGTANAGVLREDYFRTTLFYSYAFGNQFYRADSYADKDQVDYYETHYSGLLAAYGLTDALTIESEIGYFPQKMQDYDIGKIQSSGFSHVIISAKYNVFNSIVNETEVTLGGGGKIPLGISESIDYQYVHSSSGAFGINFQAFLHKGYKKQGLHLFLINRSEYNLKNKNNFQYGASYNTSFFVTKALLDNLTGLLEIRNDIREKDKIQDIIQKNTGGLFFHISPQLNYTIGSFNISALFDYPFYQYYNGYQLGNNYSIALNLTWQTKIGR
ncbi:hypothetical protein ACFLSQ_07565 [Bacteroidota bacterium]